jgi:hypothetical protein
LIVPASLAQVATGFRHTKREEYSAPKTVLGFYAIVLAVLEAGVIGATAVLATQKELRDIVPWVLAFGGVVLVVLIGVVVTINVRAPMKLQLGQVSGSDLIAYEQMTLGNSTTGEYVENVPIAMPPGGQRPWPSPPGSADDIVEDEGTSP